MNEHYIGEQGIKTTLKEFVEKAIETLRDKPIRDRAVKFADDITDIRKLGHSAPLESICSLPADYRYGYSGFAGCILYVEKLR